MRIVFILLVIAFIVSGCGRQEVYAPSNSQITVLGSRVLLEDASKSRDEHFFVIKEQGSNTTTIEVGRQGQVPQFRGPAAAVDPCQSAQGSMSTSTHQYICNAPVPYPYGYQQPYGTIPPAYPSYLGYCPMPAAPTYYLMPSTMPQVFYLQ